MERIGEVSTLKVLAGLPDRSSESCIPPPTPGELSPANLESESGVTGGGLRLGLFEPSLDRSAFS